MKFHGSEGLYFFFLSDIACISSQAKHNLDAINLFPKNSVTLHIFCEVGHFRTFLAKIYFYNNQLMKYVAIIQWYDINLKM